MQREVTWLLKKNRSCRKCGGMFPKGSSVGKFLRHVQSCKGNSNSAITSYAHRLWNRILRKPKLCPTCQKPMSFVKITGPDDDQVTHDWVCETCDVTPDEEMEEEGP